MKKDSEKELLNVSLIIANIDDATELHEMQVKTFAPLLDKYQDYDTNPANEPIDRTINRIKQPFTDYYIIKYKEQSIGGVRIIKKGNRAYRLGPIFILPKYQGIGIAQVVFKLIEKKYDDAVIWDLDTILEEKGNCYLYEKIGYKKTGVTDKINENMTIIYYEKHIEP